MVDSSPGSGPAILKPDNRQCKQHISFDIHAFLTSHSCFQFIATHFCYGGTYYLLYKSEKMSVCILAHS